MATGDATGLPGQLHGLADLMGPVFRGKSQQARPSPTDHAAPGSSLQSGLPHFAPALDEAPAVGLMNAVVHPGFNEFPIPGPQTPQQQGQAAEVGHRIGNRDAAGHGPPRLGCAQANPRNRHHRMDGGMPFTPHHPPVGHRRFGRQAQPTQERGHHIVWMAFDHDGKLQEFFPAQKIPNQGIGPDQAGHNRRCAAAQTPRRGDSQSNSGLQPHRLHARFLPNPLGGAVDEVVGSTPQVGSLRPLNQEIEPVDPPFDHPQLKTVIEIKGRTEAIKSRTNIGCGGRDIHHDPLADQGLSHRPLSAPLSVPSPRQRACGLGTPH